MLPAGARCAPDDVPCAAPTTCLGTAGSETCTTAVDIAVGGRCTPDDTRDHCIDSACVVEGDAAFCTTPFAEFCAAPVRVLVGTTAELLPAATDVFAPRCGGFSAVDRVYDYVVTHANARIIITPDAATTISVFTGTCIDNEIETCAAGVSGGSGVTVRTAGDVVTFVASTQTNVAFTLREDAL